MKKSNMVQADLFCESLTARTIRRDREEKEKAGRTEILLKDKNGEVDGDGLDGSGDGIVEEIVPVAKKGVVISKSDALQIVESFVKGAGDVLSHELVPYPEWQRDQAGGSRRKGGTDKLDSFDLLCHANSREHTNIVVCREARYGRCPVKDAFFVFNPAKGGTKYFQLHAERHQSTHRPAVQSKLPASTKAKIARSAVSVVVEYNRPFSFAEGSGMKAFSGTIFRAGQRCPVSSTYDIKESLPVAKTVTTAVGKLADAARKDFRENGLSVAQKMGGGISTDGLKQKTTGKSFYDVNLSHFVIKEGGPLVHASLVLRSRTLLVEEHEGPAAASNIVSTLNTAMTRDYGLTFTELLSNSTGVTDRANTMPNVVGASASGRKVPFGKKWVPFSPHHLETVMKTVMVSAGLDDPIMKTMREILNHAKDVVRIFKRSGLQNRPETGMSLIQEMKVRFGTTYAPAERFVKALSEVAYIAEDSDNVSLDKHLEGILIERTTDGEFSDAPALNCIVVCFSSIISAQRKLEADKTPTMHLVLPFLDHIRNDLQDLSYPSSDESIYTKTLAKYTLAEVMKMEPYPFHAAATMLLPSLQNLEFIAEKSGRGELVASGSFLLRRLMSETDARKEKMALKSAGASSDTSGPVSHISGKRRRGASFSLNALCDSRRNISTRSSDELALYLGSERLVDKFRDAYDLENSFAAPTFWLHRKTAFPELFSASMRVLATPAGATRSERTFSDVNLTVTPNCSKTLSKNLNNCMVAKSARRDGVDLTAIVDKESSAPSLQF